MVYIRCCVFLAVLFVALCGHAAQVSDSRDVVNKTNADAIASQKRIDRVAIDTQGLLREYRKLLEGVEYEEAQRRELESLEQVQLTQIAELEAQVSAAKLTRQRIVPLMRTMAESLQSFVLLDLPFHQEQRIAAVLSLQQRLSQPDLPLSTKFRLLLEAWQLEQDYGNTIESWRGKALLEGEELSVEYLRVGRVALYYQQLDGSASGYWDRAAGAWQPLEPGFNRSLAQALRVARKQSAPQLLLLPISRPAGASS